MERDITGLGNKIEILFFYSLLVSTMLVQSMQNVLIKDVQNKLCYYVEIQWDNYMGSIHICLKKNAILTTVSRMRLNYTTYYHREYVVKRVVVKKITNKNPHIKIVIPSY
jgi:hypothetical protein